MTPTFDNCYMKMKIKMIFAKEVKRDGNLRVEGFTLVTSIPKNRGQLFQWIFGLNITWESSIASQNHPNILRISMDACKESNRNQFIRVQAKKQQIIGIKIFRHHGNDYALQRSSVFSTRFAGNQFLPLKMKEDQWRPNSETHIVTIAWHIVSVDLNPPILVISWM